MANQPQELQPPSSMPNVNPTDVGGSGQTRLIVDAVKESVAELKADVRTIRDHRYTDMMYHLAVLVGAGILLGGMMIAAYFKIQDKLDDLSTRSTRVETKLEDLLQRIPPVATSPNAPQRK